MSETTEKKSKTKVCHYSGSAGGWGALASTSKHLLKSNSPLKNIRTLLKTNQKTGFDCPGCAWGDSKHNQTASFCENGAKAVNWEATTKKVDGDFFAKYSVAQLEQQSDYFLEDQGRLIEPMRYNAQTDHYDAISWDNAFKLIAQHLQQLDSPDQAEFYTSGRASNEAAFLYQLFVRTYGTNNFPDCSNMCHEASGVGMAESLGTSKGTVTIEDFEAADAILIFGQNPGTNHPRMLDTLRDAAKKGAKIISFNNLRERGLERFTHPQNPVEMLTNGHTAISTHYFTPRLGGDMALVRGVVKALIALNKQALANGKRSLFDDAFISQHTSGLAEYLTTVENTDWAFIETQSGLRKADMFEVAEIYAQSERVICTWAMGITQHQHSVETVQEIVNLQLLGGHVGRAGSGLSPVRGHSNVQGDRSMGINEKAPKKLLDRMEKVFNRHFPRHEGHNAIQAVEAMHTGKAKVFIALGGNFAAAMSDTKITRDAMRQCELVVNISTKLNRSHLTPGKDALILPCLGRTELDITDAGEQAITVEDSMSMVHLSGGLLKPASNYLLSEVSIIAKMAEATLGNAPVDWSVMANDYAQVRDLIEACIPEFYDFNVRLKKPGGFYLGNKSDERIWETPSEKALFKANALPEKLIEDVIAERIQDKPVLSMQTLRSHDQYNTTIYGLNDRYRGVKNGRDVIFMHQDDIDALGLTASQTVNITSHWLDGSMREVTGFKVVPYDIPRGNVAAYYPETNPLVPLQSYGKRSFTPTSKSIAVTIMPA